MQIVIPMSGFGERFRRAGYDVPKPLIEVDGKPIIAHVIDLFPGETDFVFICNQDHLDCERYRMQEILEQYAPEGKVIGIAPHKLGPVHAVTQVFDAIDDGKPTVVNYCDFTCYWDYQDFKKFLKECDPAGCVPAYRGFHPHSLGSTFYAYMRHDELWMQDIQEKQPFTDRPMEEFASSGTYYFNSGALLKEYFTKTIEQELQTNGEYYVSLVYKPLVADGKPVAIYELEHFMQWGTPGDLVEYQRWSRLFKDLVESDYTQPNHGGAQLIPMAGLGQRFKDRGYQTTKPLIPVSTRPMVVQAASCLPQADEHVFVVRKDLEGVEEVEEKLVDTFSSTSIVTLDGLSEGQACSAVAGMDKLRPDQVVTIGACDNGALYDARKFQSLLERDDADVIVWAVRGHPEAARRPEAFGWLDVDDDGRIQSVSVKKPLENPTCDPIVLGTFTFKRASTFAESCERMFAADDRVNNEFYVDSSINHALELGYRCHIFEVDHYLGWGTPDDLNTFNYWQSCFHKWPQHPYRVQKDPMIDAHQIHTFEATLKPMVPERPGMSR